MNRRLGFAAAAVATVALFGCGRQRESTPTPPRAVRTVEARRAETAATPYAGSFEPKVALDLAFGVGGRVRTVATRDDGSPLREGDVVSKGRLLAELDAADLKRQAASAALAATGAETEVRAAETSAAQTDLDLARATKLAATGALPAAELDRVETANKAAHARLEALRAQHGVKVEQLAIARRVAGDTRLTSPIEGVVARRMIDPGESIGPQTVAFTIIDTTEMRLVIAVPDARIGDMKRGALVPIRTEALRGETFVGRITAIHAVADPALRTFTVEVTIPNPNGRLRAGMVASASLGDDDAKSARVLVVPLASIVRAPDGALAVFTVTDGRASLERVEVGDLVGNDVIVESGLGAGDHVVVDGAPLLHDAERVDVVP